MVDILAVRGDERRVLDCDMNRRAVKQALTLLFLNGGTQLVEILVTVW